MTKRQLESAKKQIIAARDKIDAEARKRRKIPRWRKIAYALWWRGPQREWIIKWEAKHAANLKRATHNAIQIAKRGGA